VSAYLVRPPIINKQKSKKKMEPTKIRKTIKKVTVELWQDILTKECKEDGTPIASGEVVAQGSAITDITDDPDNGTLILHDYRTGRQILDAAPNIAERFLDAISDYNYEGKKERETRLFRESFTKQLLRVLYDIKSDV